MRLPRTLLCALLLAASACGSDTSGTILSSSSGPPTSLSLSGVWSGGVADSLRQAIMTWQLTQNGGNISGTVVATSTIGAPVFTSGTVAGTLSGTTLTFTVTIPKGSIADLPDCTLTLTGSATDITATGMSGTYTGTDSCRGSVVGGRLNFVKQ